MISRDDRSETMRTLATSWRARAYTVANILEKAADTIEQDAARFRTIDAKHGRIARELRSTARYIFKQGFHAEAEALDHIADELDPQ